MNTGNTAFGYTGSQSTAECMVSRLGSTAPRIVHGLPPLFVIPSFPSQPSPPPPSITHLFLSVCVAHPGDASRV